MLMVRAGDAVDQTVAQLLRRQQPLPRHQPPRCRPARTRHPLPRRRRLRRRRRRAPRPLHHARRQRRRLAARQTHPASHCCQNQRRRTLLRLGRRGRRGALRQNGAQRHRIRRHAAHLRGLPHPQRRPRPHLPRNARRLCRLEKNRAGQLPYRHHRRHPRL